MIEPKDDIFYYLERAAKGLLVTILIAMAIILIESCAPCKHCTQKVPIRDSLVKETTHTIVFNEMKLLGKLTDTLARQILPPSERSHLVTDAATSDAWIDNDGKLNHTLSNKTDGLTPVIVNVPNSVTTEKIYLTRNLVQYVEKELSQREEFLLFLGKMSLFMVILTILYLGFKLWKKVKSFGLF